MRSALVIVLSQQIKTLTLAMALATTLSANAQEHANKNQSDTASIQTEPTEAEETGHDAPEGDDKKVAPGSAHLKGDFHYDYNFHGPHNQGFSTWHGPDLQATFGLSKGVMLKIHAAVDNMIYQDNNTLFNPANSAALFEEAALILDFDEIAQKPILLVVGKQDMSFGLFETRMPLDYTSPIYEFAQIKGVFGVSVQVDQRLAKIFDQVTATVFASDRDKMSIRGGPSGALTVTKRLSDHVQATGSLALLATPILDPKSGRLNEETKTVSALGLVYKEGKSWKVYTQAAYSEISGYVYTLGGARAVGEKGELAAEFTKGHARDQVGAGYNYQFDPKLSTGAQVTYDFCHRDATLLNQPCKTGAGVAMRMRYLFEKTVSLHKQWNDCSAGDPGCAREFKQQPTPIQK